MKKFFPVFLLSIVFMSCQMGEKRKRQAGDHLRMAVSLIKKCDHKRAVIHLLKSLSFTKNDPLLRHTLASTYFLMGQYALSTKEYRKALQVKRNFTDARVGLARAYIERGLVNEALEELALAEKDITYTNYLKLVGNKALAFFKKKEYKEAEKWLVEMKGLSKKDQDKCFAFLYMGRTHLNRGNLKAAEKDFIQAVSWCQKTSPLCAKPRFEEHYFLAKTYRKKQDWQSAGYQLKVFLSRADRNNPYRQKALKLLRKVRKRK